MSKISVEKIPHNGALVCSVRTNEGVLITHSFPGYSRREAIKKFRTKLPKAILCVEIFNQLINLSYL